jgi:hypothetical protein
VGEGKEMKYPYKIYRRKTSFDYLVHIEMVFDGSTFYSQHRVWTHDKDRQHVAHEIKMARKKMKRNIIDLIEKYRMDLAK